MSLRDVLLAFGFPALLALGWSTAREVWSGERDAYQDTWVVRLFIGSSGSDGFNAMIPMAPVFMGLGYLAIAPGLFRPVLPAGWYEGLAVAAHVPAALVPVAMVCTATLLLFLRPRFLAPPHLRDKRGWIPQTWHQWRTRARQHKPSSE